MTQNPQLDQLYQTALTTHDRLTQTNPQWSELHPSPINMDDHSSQRKLQIKISKEERDSIFEKLRSLFSNQELLKNLEMKLYLEQQLSDLMSLEVVSELEGFSLPHTTAKIRAASHRKLGFDDQLNTHSAIHEAGLSSRRPFFGWSQPRTPAAEAAEQYGITLPLHLLEQWQTDKQTTLKWFKYRHVLIVNPWKELACIGVVNDLGPTHTTRYQAEASPELVRATQLWFPGLSGRGCLFLLDHDNSLKPGPIKF
jgi:hypothetical protein